jgi:ABC-type amino acid transport substrate-binding protein
MDEAVKLLEENKVDGVVCDTPLASNYLRHHNLPNLVLSPVILEHDELSFAVKRNSPLRHAIDLGITSFQDDDSVVPLCRRYIGDEAKNCDL